ncbi:hypothetical protein DH2020_001185 [Rehmannia glutinosa]|uniref:C2 domain-containing protein n=1 Tax=Rehmannia glutinosa TaxID=99300 RepID=A0ABR0XYZ6_REHGL
MASGTAPRPPPKLYDLELTIVSAKHLKNVNWRNGDLKPYVILWVNPDRRQATKPDDSGSTRPVWNERDSILTLKSSTPNPRRLRNPWSVPSDLNSEISWSTPTNRRSDSKRSSSSAPPAVPTARSASSSA